MPADVFYNFDEIELNWIILRTVHDKCKNNKIKKTSEYFSIIQDWAKLVKHPVCCFTMNYTKSDMNKSL